MDRRRNGEAGKGPLDTLRELPAVVALERLPVAALAISADGVIVFANSAGAEMLGYRQDDLLSLPFRDIFRAMPGDQSAVAAIRAYADVVVHLAHKDGSTVRARMSKSALRREDDPVVLAVFHDLTEKLWHEEL